MFLKITVLKRLHLPYNSDITRKDSQCLPIMIVPKAYLGVFYLSSLYSHFVEKEAVITSRKGSLPKC